MDRASVASTAGSWDRPFIAIPQSAFRNPQSSFCDPQTAPRPTRDFRRRRRLPTGPRRCTPLPADPRRLSQLGLSQGPPRSRGASGRRRPARGGGGDRPRRPGAARTDPRDRLVLSVPWQDHSQVLPLLSVRVEARRPRTPDGRRHQRLRVVSPRCRPPHHLLRQRARGAGAGHRHGTGAHPRSHRMTAGVKHRHHRAEPRRAVKRGYPRQAGSVRLCRTLGAVERLLYQRLVDAVVLDVKAAPEAALALPARFPRIPMFVLSALRPDDGALLATCHASGFAGLLVEGVDNAVAGEWIAARTAQVARREALADAPRLLRLTDRLQLAAVLRVTREHLSREFAAGGAPNLKRVIDLARAACAADLLGNPGYTVRAVVRSSGLPRRAIWPAWPAGWPARRPRNCGAWGQQACWR